MTGKPIVITNIDHADAVQTPREFVDPRNQLTKTIPPANPNPPNTAIRLARPQNRPVAPTRGTPSVEGQRSTQLRSLTDRLQKATL